MTWAVPWQGKEYDVDPTDFTGLELSRIKQRTGLTYRQLVRDIGQMDADAIRAVFWTVDYRDDPNLAYSEYDGPPMSVILPRMEAFNDAMVAVGKALGMPDETSETPGGPSSATSTAAPSATEKSTTD